MLKSPNTLEILYIITNVHSFPLFYPLPSDSWTIGQAKYVQMMT